MIVKGAVETCDTTILKNGCNVPVQTNQTTKESGKKHEYQAE